MKPEENIGRSWISREGRKQVIGLHPTGRYLIQVEGKAFPELVAFDELEDTITFDERAAASHERSRVRAEEERRSEAEQEAKEQFTYGFAEQFSPTKRARVIKTLNAQVRHHGEFLSRKELIVRLVREGWIVKDGRLVSPEGNRFFFQKDLTKTGLDFATYLVESGVLKKSKTVSTGNMKNLKARLLR